MPNTKISFWKDDYDKIQRDVDSLRKTISRIALNPILRDDISNTLDGIYKRLNKGLKHG